MTNAGKILDGARSHLSWSGRPNDATHWYASKHGSEFLTASWCDMFVSYVGYKAGLGSVIGEFAYCPSHINWFKSRKQWGSTPKVGAVVFFDWDNDNVADHVGFVEGYSGGTVTTIEGNTSNAVHRRTRYPSDIIGYGYPAYGDPKPVVLLRKGSKGAAVTAAQKALIKAGYKLPKYGADGQFGDETEDAVKRLQKNRKIEVDGVIGPDTRKELKL